MNDVFPVFPWILCFDLLLLQYTDWWFQIFESTEIYYMRYAILNLILIIFLQTIVHNYDTYVSNSNIHF